MILLMSEIKKFLRHILPSKIYTEVYSFFKKIKGGQIEVTDKLKKQMRFTKKGTYVFSLGQTQFDIVLDPDNGVVDSEIYADGVYEPEILTIIQKHLTANSVFVDIGANIGQHSLYASRFANKVYAFEPIKKIYDQFVESKIKNNFNTIQIYNYALGNQEITLPIFGNVNNMGASSLVSIENRKKIQDIQVKRFDDVVSELGIGKIDFIKIDVEGYELDVLLGARKSIERYTPILLIEYSPYFYNQIDSDIGQKIITFLLEAGYIIYDINDGALEKRLVKSIDDMNEIMQTNILCIHEKV